MKTTATALFAGKLILVGGAALADSANWSDEKANQVYQNRNSDSGYGNGGEKYAGSGSGVIISKTGETT